MIPFRIVRSNGGYQEWEEGNEELLFHGFRVSGWGEEQFLEMEGGDGCMTG